MVDREIDATGWQKEFDIGVAEQLIRVAKGAGTILKRFVRAFDYPDDNTTGIDKMVLDEPETRMAEYWQPVLDWTDEHGTPDR